MRRNKVNKRKSARAFNRSTKTTKKANMRGVMRGGYRL